MVCVIVDTHWNSSSARVIPREREGEGRKWKGEKKDREGRGEVNY